jgi:hypothetical protein
MLKEKSKILFLLMLVSSFIIVGCGNKEKVLYTQSTTFINDDWNFEHRKLLYEMDVNTDKPCKIILELLCTKELTAEQVPLTFSIYAPDGSEAHTSSTANFTSQYDDMTNSVKGDLTTYTIVLYKQKYFNVTGKYKFQLLQTYEKYNLLGIRSATLKIIETKEME